MVDDVGVNLAQGDQPPLGRALSEARECPKFLQESLAVAFYRRAGIVFRQSEVEIASAISVRESSDAGGKTMDQPWELFELTRTKRRDSGFPGRNGWHISIIKDARYLRAFGHASKPNILIERQHDVRCESRIPLDADLQGKRRHSRSAASGTIRYRE